MSRYIPYIGLATLHVARVLALNPIQVRWGFTNGFESMPSDVAKRVRTVNRRYMGFLIDGLTVFFVAFLMREVSVSWTALGFRMEHWKGYCAIGVVAGSVWLVLQKLSSYLYLYFAREQRPQLGFDYMQEGTSGLWIANFVGGVFAEEVWRSFCIVGLLKIGDSAPFAVVITAVVFALAHYGRPLLERLGIIPLGIAAAVLFMASGSLLLTCLFHVVVNLGSFYRIRRAVRVV